LANKSVMYVKKLLFRVVQTIAELGGRMAETDTGLNIRSKAGTRPESVVPSSRNIRRGDSHIV
jgi:hypothetical protein